MDRYGCQEKKGSFAHPWGPNPLKQSGNVVDNSHLSAGSCSRGPNLCFEDGWSQGSRRIRTARKDKEALIILQSAPFKERASGREPSFE